MKTRLTLLLLAASALPVLAQQPLPPLEDPNLSLKNEIQHAIDQGVKWFEANQEKETGSWSDTDQPALTALAVSCIMGDPRRKPTDDVPPSAAKGYAFLATKAKDDGGIYGKGMAAYNTSLSLMALLLYPDSDLDRLRLDARRFLINQQSDFDVRGEADNKYDGGIGYGGTYAHSDLSNTHFALEALYYSQALVAESGSEKDKKIDLDWNAAITFVARCQNTTETSDAEEAGGFVYFPGDSKAGTKELPDGSVALRSYGSMGYAGLLSFIYAGMDKEDPRVEAVLEWLRNNYSIDENPGMGTEGLYYYYHTMAKALAICEVEELELKDGRKVDWRRDLAVRLINQQDKDGHWTNETARWWENDPALVTAYSILSLEHIYRSL